MDKEGTNYGLLIKQHRQQRGWTRAQLADLYGKAIREAPISVEAIRLMEEKNRVPVNPKRRAILAGLLGIPLALFGLTTLELTDEEETLQPKKRICCNKDHYQVKLADYWNQHYTNTASDAVADIMECIHTIRDELPYSHEQAQLLETLCGYHLVLANILRDQQYNKHAIMHLNKAYHLAKMLNKPTMQGVVLYRRAWVLCDEGQFAQAAENFEVGYTLVPPQQASTAQLVGALQLGAGHARMQRVESHSDMLIELRRMDKAQGGVGDGEDPYFLRFNEERYHLDKAAALLGAPEGYRAPADALEHLALARQHSTPGYTRRGAYNLILESQAHIQQGYFATATVLASEALKTVRMVKSQANIARIADLYASLQETSYRYESDLAELGLEIMKVKHPNIFQ